MNWTVELIESLNFVKITIWGDFNVEDSLKIIKDFISRDFWEPGMKTMFDCRRIIFYNLALGVLREIGEFYALQNERIGDGKMALLMGSPRDFGIARQFEMLTEGKILSQVHVFLNETEAVSWLTAEPAAA